MIMYYICGLSYLASLPMGNYGFAATALSEQRNTQATEQ